MLATQGYGVGGQIATHGYGSFAGAAAQIIHGVKHFFQSFRDWGQLSRRAFGFSSDRETDLESKRETTFTREQP